MSDCAERAPTNVSFFGCTLGARRALETGLDSSDMVEPFSRYGLRHISKKTGGLFVIWYGTKPNAERTLAGSR